MNKGLFASSSEKEGFFSSAWRAAAWGLLAAAALPPLTLAPVLLVAIPGLLRVIGQAKNWRVAATAGLAFGFVHHMAGLYWITGAILVMAAQFWWAVPIVVPLLSFVLALFIAVPCALAWLAPAGWRRVAVLAGAWVGGDLLRQFVLSGFPWNPLGSAVEFPGLVGLALMQPAAWVGVGGLTLATLLVAASPSLGRRGWIAGAVLFAAWLAVGFARLEGSEPVAATPSGLVAVIVQGDVPEAEHRDHGTEPAWARRIFERHLLLTRQGMAEAAGRPAIVVWPETASPYELTVDRGARQALAGAASPALVALSGTIRFEGDTVAHNSLVAVSPGGDVAGIYDKSHLVPFGEYFPVYSHFILGEQGFTPGPGLRTLHLPGLPAIGPLVCYEAIFSGQVTVPGDRPGLLVNITNDAWFGDSAGPRQHLAAARLRSVEEGLPMVRAANTGISAVIDSAGRIRSRLGLDRAGVLVDQVPGALPITFFGKFGLLIPFLLAAATLACGGVRRSHTKMYKKLEITAEKRNLG